MNSVIILDILFMFAIGVYTASVVSTGDAACNGTNTNGCTNDTDDKIYFTELSSGSCVLPPYPENGRYKVTGASDSSPGQKMDIVYLTVTCNPGYAVDGQDSLYCIHGRWFSKIPVCSPCGIVDLTPGLDDRVLEGRTASYGEVPWHAGIYSKRNELHRQICGGSLISSTVVVSAAHCFWSEILKLLSPSMFAVAVGKINIAWKGPQDANAQYSDVTDIKIPANYIGGSGNYAGDLALVFLTTTIGFNSYVRPICLNFDTNFDRQQLRSGSLGKVAGWGLTSPNGTASPVLEVVDLAYVDTDACIAKAPPEFRGFITADKICAGYTNGTGLCVGDSGGGLAFFDSEGGTLRYYLRGVVSTAPIDENNFCNAHTYTAFTQIVKHKEFFEQSLTNSKESFQ